MFTNDHPYDVGMQYVQWQVGSLAGERPLAIRDEGGVELGVDPRGVVGEQVEAQQAVAAQESPGLQRIKQPPTPMTPELHTVIKLAGL